MWKELSEELAQATARAAQGVVHLGGDGVAGRTALLWAPGVAVTVARQASDGELVPVVGATSAKVRAWDPRTGLAVFDVEGVPAPHWTLGALPTLGALVLTVAQPSSQGPEARLDAVRFVGGATEWGRGVTLDHLIQTDGAPFPGFLGAAVVDSSGALVGMVAENRGGNGGYVVPVADLGRQVEALLASGSPRRPWLGVSTRPAGGQGLVLLGVEGGGPADQAGWKPQDVLLSLGDAVLKEPSDLVRALAHLAVGVACPARLLREAQVVERPVTPGAR